MFNDLRPTGLCVVPELWSEPSWEEVWPVLVPWGTASTPWDVSRKYGPHGEVFFFPKKEAGGGFK